MIIKPYEQKSHLIDIQTNIYMWLMNDIIMVKVHIQQLLKYAFHSTHVREYIIT